jgi:sensor histidine kinase YesM
MKKISIYAAIIVSIGLSFVAWEFYTLNNQFNNDHHYYKVDFSYENAKPFDVGFIEDSTGNTKYFIVLGQTSDHKLCIRYGRKVSLINKAEFSRKRFLSDGTEIQGTHRWVSELFNNKEIWQEHLSVISQNQIDELSKNSIVYYYTRSLEKNDYPDNLIMIPESLLFIIGLFTNFFVISTLVEKIKYHYYKFGVLLVYFSILFIAYFVAWFFSQSSVSTLFLIFFGKNLFTFFPLYWFIQWTNKKYKHLDFGKRELIKFLYIILLAFLIELIGGNICNYLFFKVFEFGGGTMYEFGSFSNVLGWFKFWIFFGVANFMSNLTFYIIALRKKEKLFKLQQSEGTLASSTLASIQSRINPHFLYNALNSIASLARTEPKKTEEMALQLAKFYEQCSDIKSRPLISLAEELEILKSYLKIEKIRFGERLQVVLPTNDDVLDTMIPSFTLQPIVENAIKYGYNTDENVIKIRITAETNDKSLTLRIYDSGPPFSDNMHSGYGLSSIAKKLKVLYPDRHTISFINKPEKCVEIMLNAKKMNQ